MRSATARTKPWSRACFDTQELPALEAQLGNNPKIKVIGVLTSQVDVLRMRVDLEPFPGRRRRAHWYDPRTGAATLLEAFVRGGSRVFTVPGEGDWVLVVDDEAKRYGPPGGRVR